MEGGYVLGEDAFQMAYPSFSRMTHFKQSRSSDGGYRGFVSTAMGGQRPRTKVGTLPTLAGIPQILLSLLHLAANSLGDRYIRASLTRIFLLPRYSETESIRGMSVLSVFDPDSFAVDNCHAG